MHDADTPAEAPVRIVRLVIDELFGPGSSTIDIPFKLEQRVTVLHGRNGSGKTITLKLLEAISEERFEVLVEYPFKRLRLELSDGQSLEIKREENTSSEIPTLYYSLTTNVGSDLARTGSVHIRPPFVLQRHYELREFLAWVPSIKFIKADRLFVRESQDQDDEPAAPQLMVERLSQDLRKHIVAADRQYRLISTQLDSTLPKRLFADHGDLPSLDALERREQGLQRQAARLVALGLLREQPDALGRSTLNDEQKKTFFIILQDREEKLRPFTSIADKAQRLLDSLNRKLAPKSVRLDVESGYQVFSANGTLLPLHCLSSGEQHEFVLLHELWFDVQPGSLILIDEPELSLHVTWQEDVLPELLDIAQLANLDFLLATHSPYIVGDHEELMVRLGEPV